MRTLLDGYIREAPQAQFNRVCDEVIEDLRKATPRYGPLSKRLIDDARFLDSPRDGLFYAAEQIIEHERPFGWMGTFTEHDMLKLFFAEYLADQGL
jgi:hypothetical protein